METWDAIRSRRNVRQYTDKPVSGGDLDRILEAGRRSPSSRNGQPWNFVVVTDRDRLTELAGVWRGAGHVAMSAATIALVVRVPDEERPRRSLWYDLGQASMSMMLAAADLGLGTCHAAVADQDLARRVLGHPDDLVVAYMFSLGFPADRPLAPIRNPSRRPFDEVVHRDRW